MEIVKERNLDLPFIFVWGRYREDVVVQAIKAGAQDYVTKNNLARLVPAMEREVKTCERRQAQELHLLLTTAAEGEGLLRI